jgi:hypothetical protein
MSADFTFYSLSLQICWRFFLARMFKLDFLFFDLDLIFEYSVLY